jgi:hypothetical protein
MGPLVLVLYCGGTTQQQHTLCSEPSGEARREHGIGRQ